MKVYWQFYWPLALTGMGLVLSVQMQNATLARYPDAVAELAVMALAHGMFGFFNAGLQFISQLANVYGRSPAARRRVQRFVCAVGLTFSLPLLGVALLPVGHVALARIFDIDATLAGRVAAYLTLMSPLLLANAQRHYLTGLLIQSQRSGWVTVLNYGYLTVVGVFLIVAFQAGLPPMIVVVGAELTGVAVLVVSLFIAHRRLYLSPAVQEHADVTWRELLQFFLPVSTTGVMFALSRPVLFAFVARTPDALVSIAALRIAFDFTMLFQQAANQFRHFFITFGFDDLQRKRQFMACISMGLTALMLLFTFTPVADFVWGTLLGLDSELQGRAQQATAILCLTPLVLVYRNYFHSRLMQLRRTAGMAWGSSARVVFIAAAAASLSTTGWLTHTTAAACLLLGFVVEALYARWDHHRREGVTSKGG